MTHEIAPELSPDQFIQALLARGHRRASWVLDAERGQLLSSSPELAAIGRELSGNIRDFAGHEAIFFELGRETNALLAAFVHKTTRGQAAGGVRHWAYDRITALLADGLRLAQGMGRKNALAGLWWGGGKGIIARQLDADPRDPGYRRAVYRDYGHFITSLRGVYVTAEDVGTTAADMAHVFETTRFVTCVPPEVGGSGNPSGATARGVVCAMEAACEHLGLGNLRSKRIAMQGAGNVARFMVGELLQRDVGRITVTDISAEAIEALKERYADERIDARVTDRADQSIFETPCDIFAPNALGGVINPGTTGRLNTTIVCGAANNQLLDAQRDADALAQRGIVHVPDFVANRMGIVQCANEQYGSLPNDPSIVRHFDSNWEHSVFSVTQQVLQRARAEQVTPTAAANALADEQSTQPHPLWPGRGRQIIQSLVASGWQDIRDKPLAAQ